MLQPDLTTDQDIEALEPERALLLERTQNLTIKNDGAYAECGLWLKTIKGAIAKIEAARTRITKPLNDSLREVNAQAKAAAAPFLNSEQQIKRAMIDYSNEQDRIRAEEQRKANAAAEKERLRLQAIADKALAKGQEDKASAFQDRAAAVVAPVAQQAAPKMEGIATRVAYEFEITDEDLIPREYLVIDVKKIRSVVTALKLGTKIPGVRVFEVKRIAAGVV